MIMIIGLSVKKGKTRGQNRQTLNPDLDATETAPTSLREQPPFMPPNSSDTTASLPSPSSVNSRDLSLNSSGEVVNKEQGLERELKLGEPAIAERESSETHQRIDEEMKGSRAQEKDSHSHKESHSVTEKENVSAASFHRSPLSEHQHREHQEEVKGSGAQEHEREEKKEAVAITSAPSSQLSSHSPTGARQPTPDTVSFDEQGTRAAAQTEVLAWSVGQLKSHVCAALRGQYVCSSFVIPLNYPGACSSVSIPLRS